MTIYARSGHAAVTVSPEGHGGCGRTHSRPAPGGVPAKTWALDCPPCEDHLRHDPHWAATPVEIPETYDEKLARENFEKRGAKDKDAILTLALARLAGIGPAELPESLTQMITGTPAHIPGTLECPSGHAQPPGMKFCGECGAAMHGTPAQAALPVVSKTADTPKATAPGGRLPRIRDQRTEILQGLAAAHGVSFPDGCKRADLVVLLSNASVTNADLARYLDQVPAAA